MKTSKLILLLALIITGCNNESPTLKQKILFEKHYTNWAWGYQDNGLLIDSLGFVRAFDMTKKTAT